MTSPEHESPTPSERAELRQLIAGDLNGSLQPAERDRLEQLLWTSRELRVVYIAYMQLDAELNWSHRVPDALRELQRCAGDSSKLGRRPYRTASSGRSSPRMAPVTRHFRNLIAAMAACVLVAVGVSWLSEPQVVNPDDLAAGRRLDSDHTSEPAGVTANVIEVSDKCKWFVEDRSGGGKAVQDGDLIRLTEGEVRVEFHSGAVVTMRSPAALKVLSPMRARAVLGTLSAHVDARATGFTVETPKTTVVDLGTDFGINVSEHGSTDVVVFNGAVDLHSDGIKGLNARQRLTAGEAVRVSEEGTASRIVSISDNQFSFAGRSTPIQPRIPVISAVRDNVIRGKSWHYYEIVRGGMREDAKAFVDRPHEWNGIDESGIPSYLLGGDYVKMFNDDKVKQKVEIELTISRPAVLFILLDKRSPVPDWLRDHGFVNTGDEIGIDGGGYTRAGEEGVKTLGSGPGVSVDDTITIWRRDVANAGTVKLGAMHVGSSWHNMYAIAAVPMEVQTGFADLPGNIATPTGDHTRLTPTAEGTREVSSAIERPTDVDVFGVDWPGGPARVVCETGPFTTLDPVIHTYDANGTLIAFAESDPADRGTVEIEFHAPPGPCYLAVAGSDEIGEVGTYRLSVDQTTTDVDEPPAPFPSLVVDVMPTGLGEVRLSWSALPNAESYVVERSQDAVDFDAIATTSDVSFTDDRLKPGETYVYRLKAITEDKQFVSAPRLVQAAASATDWLQTFGLSSSSIALSWRDVRGDQGYRIERSSDGRGFETLATVPPNSNGYVDTHVAPDRAYAFRVVTLGDAGFEQVSKSVWAASGVGGLTAEALADNRVSLRWQEPQRTSRRLVQRAVGVGEEFVTIGAVGGEQRQFIDESAIADEKLRYKVVSVKEVDTLTESGAGKLDAVRLPDDLDEFFALRITGELKVERPGRYTFNLSSDDGSRLFIDRALVVDNDFLHIEHVASGSTDLAAGVHDLELQYFQGAGLSILDLSWEGPGISKTKVPASAFNGLKYQSYHGRWSRLPFFESTATSDVAIVNTPTLSSDVDSRGKTKQSP